jgi:23S rRNA pseudouridine2605 synthase
MSTEERDETQPRPRKVIPSVRREQTDQEGERRPYNPGYNKPEGYNYERRPYNNNRRNDGGGYNRPYGENRPAYGEQRPPYGGQRPSYGEQRPSSYGEQRPPYGDRQSRPRTYNNNREGGTYNRPYGNNNNRSGGYNNNYNREGGGYNKLSSYGSRPYGNEQRPSYNRPRPNYDNQGGGRTYPAAPAGGENTQGDGIKKRRPRVGDTHAATYDNRAGGRPSYGDRPGGNYGNNYNRRPGGQGNYRPGGYNPNAKYGVQKQLKYKEVLKDPNEPIRLNKFLSNAGVCSRREADNFIQAGVVKVNDQVVTELGTKITRQDKVMFHDKPVQIESKVYILLNKPKNCVTTSDDPEENRLTVLDLVKNACSERIYPVGRLDRNTTGVLLLTNDGDLASKLTHPSFKKKKIYQVWLDKNVVIEDMKKIANGLELEDGEIHADAISYANETDKSQVGIEIHSGRNRIVRRIFESLGYHVIRLDRVYFAGLTKKNLGRGKWRYLNEREVNALRMGAFE